MYSNSKKNHKKNIYINEKQFHLEIFDLVGVDDYKSINKLYMRNINIALLVYDITKRDSFEKLRYWSTSVYEINQKNNIILGLVGNKCDLYESQEINSQEGHNFALELNCIFFETSSKDHESVEFLFIQITNLFYKKIIELGEKEEERKAESEGKKVIRYVNGDKYIGKVLIDQKNKIKKNEDNYKKEGKGEMKYNNGDFYNGDWKNNLKEGKGKMEYNNGDIYDGFWKNNLKEGKGEMKYNNGDIYNGVWKKDLKEGKGEMKYNNGDFYNGFWKNDLKEGKGEMKYNNGDIYNGFWKNNLKEGKGKFTFNEGYYEGVWENNEFNGKVTIYYNNKNVLNGYLKNSKKEGIAIIENENGKLEINFNNDEIEGKGKITFNNGDVLIGNLDNNFNIIHGTLTYKNGDIYEGEFKEYGRRIGKGVMKNKNKEIYHGEWYKKNEGLFCLNKDDFNILQKNVDDNNLKDIFNLNLKDIFYKGNYKNNLKDGEGILYIKKNNEFSNVIYKGNFKDNKKDGLGKIYFKTGSVFEGNWKDDHFDKEKEAIFYLNNLIQFKKININIIEWCKIIEKEVLKYYGNKNKEFDDETQKIR